MEQDAADVTQETARPSVKKRFRVGVARKAFMTTYVEVEADDIAEAEDRALDLIEMRQLSGEPIDWNFTDDDGEYWAEDIEEQKNY